MTSTSLDMESSIARCRIVLSAIAILTVYVDPTIPMLSRSLGVTGGLFYIDPRALAVMGTHLAYSVAVYVLLVRHPLASSRIVGVSTCADVLFGGAIMLVTEGVSSPLLVFFSFAVLVAGLRAGLHAALLVTGASVALYLSLLVVSAPPDESAYVIRPAYLAIMGYLAGYLGQENLKQERRMRVLQAGVERERIARSLHDGYAQALAGVNLRLETCRELSRRGRYAEVLVELTELQDGVNREHDELRSYIHSLVDRDVSPIADAATGATQFSVRVDFTGSATCVEHVLQIILEGARNVRRHARARSAEIAVWADPGELVVAIDDDGVGFRASGDPPWSIASRVAELGGRLTIDPARTPGAHLRVALPAAT
jgi:signal transduction histidine kinase